MRDIGLAELERIEPYCLPPWEPRATVRIYNRDRATELAEEACLRSAIFADASDRNGLAGIGIVHSSGTTTTTIARTVGPSTSISTH